MRRWQFMGFRPGPALSAKGLYFFRGERPVYLFGAGTTTLLGTDEPTPAWSLRDARAAWTRYLDRLAGTPINLVRLNLWGFCHDDSLCGRDWSAPYRIVSAPGEIPVRYDLNRFQEAGFDLLRTICREAEHRDIVVRVVLLDDAALSIGDERGGPWLRHPWSRRCGGFCDLPTDLYDADNDEAAAHQEAFLRKVLGATAALGNVWYEVAAEAGVTLSPLERMQQTAAWLQHPLNIARQAAPGRLLGVSGSAWSEDGGSAELLWRDDKIDVLLPRETDGQRALCREEATSHFQFYSREQIAKPRFLEDVEFRGSGGRDAARRLLWTAFASGGHLMLSGGQNTDTLLQALEISQPLATFLNDAENLCWWEMQPTDGILDPNPGRCAALAREDGGEFLLYFRDRPEQRVMLSLPAAEAELRWLDPTTGLLIAVRDWQAGEPLRFPPTETLDLLLRISVKARQE